MSKTDHLAKAKEFIAKGEDYYRKAAEEMKAAKAEGVTWAAIGRAVGRNESWVRRIVSWSNNPSAPSAPFERVEGESDRKDETAARKVIADRPEVIAQAITEAPKEVQAKIADELVKAPETERSLRNIAKRSSEPAPQPILPKAERKVSDGVFRLWEAGELLLDETPTAEEKIRMIAMAEKAQRLAGGIVHLLDSGELDAEFSKLIAEVGAEA